MYTNKPRVLIISSCPLSMGPAAIAGQYYEALKRKGVDVDLLLMTPEPDNSEFLSVLEKEEKKNIIFRIIYAIRRRILGESFPKPGYCFFYKRENQPPVATKKILAKITKPYNLVYVVFWQNMLSFESIDRIYDKLHCQIQFAGVDYSQMSGGCHFTNGCERYKTGCGCCPAFDSKDENDFTAWNVRYRKKVYEKVKPIVYGNLYTLSFYKESYLLKNARLELIPSPIIDTNTFKPLEPKSLRRKYNINDEKKYIVFFACQNLDDERKGMKYLIDALNILYERLSNKASDVLVMMAGNGFDNISLMIPFDSKGVGYVSMNKLPELFSISTLFVCPSVNDAGPMMVNQSLCCGTPVVGFDIGSIKQVVKDKGTGICVPLRDSKALADGILQVLEMSDDEYQKVSAKAREVALQTSSYEVQADIILKTYQKYNCCSNKNE